MVESWTKRTLLINKVTDELFWHMARRNNATMGYGGDDAHIITLNLPNGFIDTLPDHLRAEYKWILRKVKQSKARCLEIRPVTMNDQWDRAHTVETFAEFMAKMEGRQLYVWHG